ncbi:hypothetical protein E2C01_046392 [Portunus trituberculatus]|uniref:Uncharacterized protein n=1 Tax=Portunus trituberculatus TaxID=210409 RepID=A0A5B7FYB9_PORTR|nr:hypothetical protein [Portunus trituberculatus]
MPFLLAAPALPLDKVCRASRTQPVSQIHTQNSTCTSEILKLNLASTSETFATEASRTGELPQPVKTVGNTENATISAQAS